ncbi:MAG: tyrosine-type recombinase/integrase [Gammaproteobacteria bacterium]|nr:tyrosine-type recombinase/integrase [Gammaproteobacteria bacterium]MYF29063.1 tyrosine-type recombinase/integrase [Gammaproteobacteria bacterium]MYK48345.1 tyrosine-type recombinase/integrase [Gammaproteobacteria bacterium]
MPLKLTETFVQRVKPDSRARTYGDGRGGHGLTLHVQTNGAKWWYQRLRIHGQPANVGLGGYPLVTLPEARHAALRNAQVAQDGGDPRPRKRPVPSVADTLAAVIERDAPTWRHPDRTAKNWRNVLRRHASDVLALRVDEVTSADCIAVLAPLWNTKRETGRKTKRRLAAIFNLAIAEGHRTDNPIDQASAALPNRRGDQQRIRRQAALPYHQVADALSVVAGTNAWLGTKLAFRFLVLTAARSGEVRGATWAEVDTDAALWTIPAARMKAGDEHRVPLSTAALAALSEAQAIAGDNGLLFPSARGKPMSDVTLSKLLRENHVPAVPHGFRSSFRDWAAEQTAFPRAVMEAALAHKVADEVEAAYFRSDLLEKRSELMQQWADYLSSD